MVSIFEDLAAHVKVPGLDSKIFKDECPFEFETPELESGVFICLKNFIAIGPKMLRLYHETTGCRAFLRYQINKQFKGKSSSTLDHPTKLALGVPGGFDLPQDRYTVSEHWSLIRLPQGDSFDLPNPLPQQSPSDTSHLDVLEMPKQLAASVAAVQCAESTVLAEDRANALATWEDDNVCFISAYAMNLVQIDNGVRIPPTGWKCAKCDLKDNLWLNLTDGAILCGRRFWDGSGGNNHALEHYDQTKYPLAVKLGTITPKGGEVYSYSEDAMVTDPKLAEHLAHFGIDIMKMQKTDKTLAELEISANEKLGEWLTIQEANCKLEPRYGPGMTGIRNLGNTCYLNAVIQVLFSIPYFRTNYAYQLPIWTERALANLIQAGDSLLPVDHVGLQFAKFGHGLCSGAYSWLVPDNLTQINDGPVPLLPGLRPLLFRRLMGIHNRTFATKHQQDACEFLLYLLDLLDNKTQTTDTNSPVDESNLPSSQFRFAIEERLECGLTHKVRFINHEELVLSIPVPMEAVINKQEVEDFEKRRKEVEQKGARLEPDDVVRPRVPFEACLSAWGETEKIDNFKTPASYPPGQQTFALRSNRLVNYPDYLCVQLNRFAVGSDWIPRKLDVEIEFNSVTDKHPMNWSIDLGSLRALGGPQLGEHLLDSESSQTEQISTTNEMINHEILSSLMDMGFSLEACKKACKHTHNSSLEVATNWLMEHLDDPDINDPEPGANCLTPSMIVDETSVDMMVAMGFTQEQAKNALIFNKNNLEEATNWALNNPNLLESITTNQSAQTNQIDLNKEKENNSTKIKSKLTDGNSKYELFGFISHMGKTVNDGHYVAHIKRSYLAKSIPHEPPVYHVGSPICGGNDDEWIIFNDEKVAKSENPPIRHAYLYFFHRLDN